MATVCKVVLDAAQYRKELDDVMAESRAAAGTLSRELDKTGDAARRTGGVLGKIVPESLRSKAAQAFGAIRAEMNKTAGGAGNFLGKFLAGGGAIGIIAAGLASLGKIAVTAYRGWIDGMKEAGELARRNAANIREAAEANEQLRQKSDGYLSKLSELSSAEQLSNTSKAEARKLIADLTKAYGDLGIKLDETTGKITGVDEAMVKKLQRDKDRRIAEMEAELKQLQADNNVQARIRDNAGVKVWGFRGRKGGFFGERVFGGEADIREAGQKIEENNQRVLELRRQLAELRRADPEGDYRARRQAENADLEEAFLSRRRAFMRRQHGDYLADVIGDDPVAVRRRAIDAERGSRERVRAERAFAAAQTDYEKASRIGNQDGVLDAQKRILQSKMAILASDEKIYDLERQIGEITRQQASEEEAREKRRALAVQTLSSLADNSDWAGLSAEALRASQGGDFTGEATATVRQLAEISRAMADSRSAVFGDMAIRTNSLTARGGFAGGAKLPESDRINREIAAVGRQQLEQMKMITAICEKLGTF